MNIKFKLVPKQSIRSAFSEASETLAKSVRLRSQEFPLTETKEEATLENVLYGKETALDELIP